jgi:cobalamin-dependent methionine synthase I
MSKLRIIGERLNSSNASARSIFEKRDEAALLESARRQLDAGAFAIDLNASMLMAGERNALLWAAAVLRERLDATISLDSAAADLLLELAPEFGERVILNSFTSDADQIEKSLQVIAETGASAVFMLKDHQGVPETAMLRLELASRIAATAGTAGVGPDKIFLDPILTPVATTSGGLRVALDTIGALKRNFPNFRSIGGVSNVSFGMPKRRLINRTFLAMAISHGIDAAICDPTDKELTAVVAASEIVAGHDPACRRFLEFHRETAL